MAARLVWHRLAWRTGTKGRLMADFARHARARRGWAREPVRVEDARGTALVDRRAARRWPRAVHLSNLPATEGRGRGDNAYAESFLHTLKTELTRGCLYATERELRRQLHAYMRYYNTVHLRSALHYRSPLAVERHVA